MSLTLANDLTGLVSREVDSAARITSGLGESLATGNDKFVEVVDSFLGNSLRDSEIILGAIAKNTAYSINMLSITDVYLNTISKSLQEGLKTIGSAGPLSADKLAVLQKNLDDKRAQVDLLIGTADFDGKKLLGGGAEQIDVQVGLSVTDKITLKVTDLANGKLFRTSIATALNSAISALSNANAPLLTDYFTTKAEIDTGVLNNDNLIFNAMTNVLPANGGSGTGGKITALKFGTLIYNLTTDQKKLLDQMAPVTSAALTAANAGVTFVNATANQITAMFGVGGLFAAATLLETAGNGNAEQIHVAEIQALLQDNVITDILTNPTSPTGKVIAQDVFTNALHTIRAEQAAISNQKSNVIEAADALKATTNVTQQAADSYLKTDYVETAQRYAETIRTMVAAITALQAANKVPEAAQRLIDSLAR